MAQRPQRDRTPRGRDGIPFNERNGSRSARSAQTSRLDRNLAPIRSFIDDQMVDAIFAILQFELAVAREGLDPSGEEIERLVRESKPADLLRMIRRHSTMRGLESLTSSDQRMLRWCSMISGRMETANRRVADEPSRYR